ncbi:MAG TPA: hypothetical protein DCM14_06465 [Clostridiales bacterium UBA8153]|nr:hypothetical protein [Clostridiales bacterium UBA8153]
MIFTSPTKGNTSFEGMFQYIVGFINESPESTYKLIIGSDSHIKDEVCFVTAVIVHRVGKGGRYFYTRSKYRKMGSLRQRIFYETALSLNVASQLAERLAENGHGRLNVEIHVDVGNNGQSRDLIREIVGMVLGSGFDVKTKPDSYGATKVADKHSK